MVVEPRLGGSPLPPGPHADSPTPSLPVTHSPPAPPPLRPGPTSWLTLRPPPPATWASPPSLPISRLRGVTARLRGDILHLHGDIPRLHGDIRQRRAAADRAQGKLPVTVSGRQAPRNAKHCRYVRLHNIVVTSPKHSSDIVRTFCVCQAFVELGF